MLFLQDATVRHYLGLGVNPDKIIMGIPLYGHSYTLEDVADSAIGAYADDEGREGFATLNPGFLAYFEVKIFYKSDHTTFHSIAICL